MLKSIKNILPYLRYVILAAILFFLARTFIHHAKGLSNLVITPTGWGFLLLALLSTMMAHIVAGCTWNIILISLAQPVKLIWVLQIYLKTNLAKYLPGNVWHYYGRLNAVKEQGGSLRAAVLSIMLEPLLMMAAVFILILTSSSGNNWELLILGLVLVLLMVHPSILNYGVNLLSKLKKSESVEVIIIEKYPLIPLLGETGFISLRSLGFLFAFASLIPLSVEQIPLLLTTFGLSWLSGFVIPAAPGGIGVFEVTAIAILGQDYPSAVLLAGVGLFRVVSVLAEALVALFASLIPSQLLK